MAVCGRCAVVYAFCKPFELQHRLGQLLCREHIYVLYVVVVVVVSGATAQRAPWPSHARGS